MVYKLVSLRDLVTKQKPHQKVLTTVHRMFWVVVACSLTIFATNAEIINNKGVLEDFCSSQPCGEGNTCFNTPIGYKCFCRPGDDSDDCAREEQCMLYNHTGVCRKACLDDETGFFISHLGGKFMDLRIYNNDGNVTVQDKVPVVDIKEQDPCMWQLTGKPNCCVKTKDAKIGCFAYGSTIRTIDRGVISIEQVRTGDRVESVSPDGKTIYSDVIMIMHQEPERTENMVTITTATSGSQITLTHDHLVYVSSGGEWRYAFSEKVLPGMLIQISRGPEETTSIETIKSVNREMRKGLYAPVTMTGTIVVDSVLASCYGNHPDHGVSHAVFAPIRWAYNWMPWIYNGDAVTDDGSHPYVSFLNRHVRAFTGYSLTLSQHRLDGMTNYQ